jgi:hypothetical protein
MTPSRRCDVGPTLHGRVFGRVMCYRDFRLSDSEECVSPGHKRGYCCGEDYGAALVVAHACE